MGDADRLPMANVSRIVQNALPKDSAIAKEARVALSACATVFVHYVTELAVQQCDKRKKLTLTPDDILEALREAEFDEFDAPMREALQKFRSGGGAAKKGGGGHKKQKLDDGADNGEDTPTKKEDQEGKGDGDNDAAGGVRLDHGAEGNEDKMEEDEDADVDAGKDDEVEGQKDADQDKGATSDDEAKGADTEPVEAAAADANTNDAV